MQASARRSGRPLAGANLEDRGQNFRLRFSAVMLAVSLVLSVVAVQADVPRLWRLGLFLPFFFACFGAWQGLYRTCPSLVKCGRRETADGEEVAVVDPEQRRAARRLAGRVILGASVAASLATLCVAALP